MWKKKARGWVKLQVISIMQKGKINANRLHTALPARLETRRALAESLNTLCDRTEHRAWAIIPWPLCPQMEALGSLIGAWVHSVSCSLI